MPAIDPHSGFWPDLSSPATGIFDIVPSDASDISTVTRSIMVATVGDVAVVMKDGTTGVLPALSPGVPYPVRVTRVLATGTTATGIVGLY